MEERVAQVHQSQTWFTVDHSTGADREAIFGYDRALRDIQWFVIRGEKDGSRFSYHEVKLAQMRSGEKLKKKSASTRKRELSKIGFTISRVVPGATELSTTTSVPGSNTFATV